MSPRRPRPSSEPPRHRFLSPASGYKAVSRSPLNRDSPDALGILQIQGAVAEMPHAEGRVVAEAAEVAFSAPAYSRIRLVERLCRRP